ncbi:hypothetical protein A3C09_01450 [Candidatus Uhrbacteria bacterium RIFCSPHIGHO2_02_FULL_47_44]|uniref:PPM-type phosphatase domain-containing protein n=1 Tax=Candidatus Uhrbacteria bacterium RIFCSPLOWO2_02_FULL_48_18 TaxID=1802408 RepID=A0A1F7V972_9BACT|nr:MAG: hypothetical protein A2839_02330 [Candidatus Uhrbacteria bacterium RIFCSPHIGHO2_01_FULL_47_10]OGL69831.1 MAG: hypothetical protein A3C09_01450 [Candidatus Uhrbacteria bacterium RIFCSPHIGHO2_02_FULL_47_44]OGL77451.1 MAG: hypothetical protein A3E97_00510 [Candidatus Uhrbacteria bacterium RIFCSPHIGHO2_12_FULL_47_12]OGL81812.1 MAG: hypothetical protein A3B20_01815 [Candidatus Uhrbacteria bacterium RIFCSPLOWO2_01_FULL_47_17]OGL86975.1 MAG: hypothetical protein A3I41_03405 [Candidatus Uhrbact
MIIDHTVLSLKRRHEYVSEDAYHVPKKMRFPFFAAVVNGGSMSVPQSRVAEFSTCIVQRLVASFEELGSSPDAFVRMFDQAEQEVEIRFPHQPIGATAACVSLTKEGVLNIAHIGDCRLARYAKDNFDGMDRLTHDHNADRKEELDRLQPFVKSGSFQIRLCGEWTPILDFRKRRLHYFETQRGWSDHSLRSTRAFGHPQFRPAVTHEPCVQTQQIDPNEPALYALSSKEGYKIVRKVFHRLQDRRETDVSLEQAEGLAREFFAQKPKGPKQDITIIFFKVSP